MNASEHSAALKAQPNSPTRGQCRSIREESEGAAKDRVGTSHLRASAPAPDPIRGSSAANLASPRAPIACGSIRSRSCSVQPKIVLPQMNPGSGPGQAQMHADISVRLAASGATSRISGKSLRATTMVVSSTAQPMAASKLPGRSPCTDRAAGWICKFHHEDTKTRRHEGTKARRPAHKNSAW